ncbi:MAG TPA: class I SAM-dependent methyltransferase [Blastocatellia bacterium]|nr:class I SAM-dependent methyltransferase [Blastocatellia bacterium]
MISGFSPEPDEEHFGDRWGHPESFQPLLEVRRRFIDPYFIPGSTVLEIGSGGGRWTQYFQPAGHLIVVEFNPESFAYLRHRFPDLPFTAYQTGGYEMKGVATASVDLVFTFDVFVHLEPEGIGAYLIEIERVLKPGGVAVIHYGDIRKEIARENPGFSRMTRALMEQLIAATRLRVRDHDEEIMFHSNLVVLGH